MTGALESFDVTLAGDKVLDEVHAKLVKYVVFPCPEAADAVTLWAAATHAVASLEVATRLVVKSPVKRCGKSRLLKVLAGLVARPLPAGNISAAALARCITEENPPTFLLDENDVTFGKVDKGDEKAEALRGILNNGFERGWPYRRWDASARRMEDCPTFAMVALAGIGSLPDTIEDRAVIVSLRRKAPGEEAAKYRTRRSKPEVAAAGAELGAWVEPNAAKLGEAEPDMPDGLNNDRAEDAWEPLIAVADLAGGSWPTRARQAALVLASEAAESDAEQSLEIRLLADIRTIFAALPDVSFLSTATLLAKLRDIDDAPWGAFELTARKLAMRLAKFEVRPRHDAAKTSRGYYVTDFRALFGAYLPSEPSEPSGAPDDQGKRQDGSEALDGSTRPPGSSRPDELAGQSANGRVGRFRTDPPWPEGSHGEEANR